MTFGQDSVCYTNQFYLFSKETYSTVYIAIVEEKQLKWTIHQNSSCLYTIRALIFVPSD